MVISSQGIAYLSAIAVINIVIGSLVFLRNTRSTINKLFFAITVSLTFWAANNLISDNTTSYALSKATSSLAFGAGFLVLVIMSIFAYHLRKPGVLKLRHYLIILLPAALVAVLFSTPLVYNLVTLQEYENGILYYPYLLTMVGLLVFITVNFRKRIKYGTPAEKNQTKLIMVGSTMMTMAAITSNIILPIFITADWTTKIGPAFTLFFTSSISYAVVKHRLFDIRAVVARSLAYFGITTIILLSYVSLAFILQRTVSADSDINVFQLVTSILLSVFIIFTYQPIKRFFDKLTNRIFFRDAYDPQEFIDELNQALVTNIKTDELLKRSAEIIVKNMKVEAANFHIAKTEYFQGRTVGVKPRAIDPEKATKLEQLISSIDDKVFVADDGHKTPDRKELATTMLDANSSAVIKFVNTTKHQGLGMGYLLVGQKQSGSVFSEKDFKMLEILANELTIAIENALRFEEIEQFNVTLQKKVDDATAELKRTNQKLLELDEAKDEFISMASHQLRTPLTSVKGYLSMVLEGDTGKVAGQQKELLSQAFTSAQRMVYLISDLLNVSRLKTGKFVIEAHPIYLPDVVEEELKQVEETAKSREVSIKFEKPKEFPTLNLDDTKIRQVIMNFVDNAIYYTPAGGEVVISLESKGKTAEFRVKDNGIGVPKAEQGHLFSKFYRAGNARKARPDGTGLGLFMAKKVIDSSGGEVIFESTEGKGSTFGFQFKVQPITPKTPPKIRKA